jgi:hypothetical protein
MILTSMRSNSLLVTSCGHFTSDDEHQHNPDWESAILNKFVLFMSLILILHSPDLSIIAGAH